MNPRPRVMKSLSFAGADEPVRHGRLQVQDRVLESPPGDQRPSGHPESHHHDGRDRGSNPVPQVQCQWSNLEFLKISHLLIMAFI